MSYMRGRREEGDTHHPTVANKIQRTTRPDVPPPVPEVASATDKASNIQPISSESSSINISSLPRCENERGTHQ